LLLARDKVGQAQDFVSCDFFIKLISFLIQLSTGIIVYFFCNFCNSSEEYGLISSLSSSFDFSSSCTGSSCTSCTGSSCTGSSCTGSSCACSSCSSCACSSCTGSSCTGSSSDCDSSSTLISSVISSTISGDSSWSGDSSCACSSDSPSSKPSIPVFLINLFNTIHDNDASKQFSKLYLILYFIHLLSMK